MPEKIRKLQGTVLDIEKTGKFMKDEYGDDWERCVFTLKLTNFSKRTPDETVPEAIKGKEVKLIRYCCYDWHFKLGIRKTLEPDETEAVLQGKATDTIFW